MMREKFVHKRFQLIGVMIAVLIQTAVCQAAEVIWTVTKSGEGHTQLTSPSDCKPEMDLIITQAKTYLSTNASKTLVLYFPAGTYIFNHPTSDGILISGSTSGHLTLRGAGQTSTILQFDQFDQEAIKVLSSSFITIEQMHLTRDQLSCTQGDVTNVTAGHVQFRLHAGFPDPMALYNRNPTGDVTLSAFSHADPLDPKMQPYTTYGPVASVTSLGGGLYDVALSDSVSMPNAAIGDWVSVNFRGGGTTVLITGDGSQDDFVIQDVLITRCSGVVLRTMKGADRTKVLRVTVDRAPAINGRAPCQSAPCGGPQLSAATYGADIEGCVINAPGDDAIWIASDNQTNLCTGAIVRNNIVRDALSRSINITQSTDGICTSNTIYRGANASIQIRANQDAEGTSASVRNWSIDHNTIIEGWAQSVIWLNTECIVSGLNNNIAIHDNTFISASKNNPMIHVGNTDTITINSNIVQSFSPAEDLPQTGSHPVPQPAPMVYVEYALTSVTGTGNNCVEPTDRAAVAVKPGNPGTVSVSWAGTSVGGGTFNPSADAYVSQQNATNNYGSDPDLRVRGSTKTLALQSFLKFDVTGLTGAFQSAKLRLYSDDVAMNVTISAVPNNTWAENGITWSNKPAMGSALGVQYVGTNIWVEYDVTGCVTSNGTYSFGLTGDVDIPLHNFESREDANPPQLVIITATNSVPVVQAQSLTATDGNPLPITLLATDTQPNALTYNLVSLPTNGLLVGTPPSLVYLPKKGVNGSDAFTFNAYDGIATGNTATVSISLVFIDSNSNGIPDSWEAAYGLTNGINGANADTDGDGASNYAEYMAGTNPTNKASVFAITSLQTTGSSNAVITWSSVQYHFYSVLRSTNLLGGWNTLTSNNLATPPQNVYTGAVNQAGPTFYRIRLEL